MAKIVKTDDPTLYLRNSGLKPPSYMTLNASFTPGKNKEHKRPLHIASMPPQKVK